MADIKTKVMSIEEGRCRYDNAVKLILSDIQILSRILKAFVPEYKECSLFDIEERYIERTSVQISKAGVSDLPGEAVKLQNEDTGFNEASIYYDILFRASCPDEQGKEIGLYINIEAQNSIYPGYPLEMRAVYYGARLLSSQLKIINHETNYGSLKKSYSIWVCFGASDRDTGKVSLYRMRKDDIIKNRKSLSYTKDRQYYDLISVIMMHINKKDKADNRTLELLRILMSDKNSKAEKIAALENDGIDMGNDLEGGIRDMCNLSELVWQDGRDEGLEKGHDLGKQEERTSIILNMLSNGLSIKETAYYSGLTEEEVRKISEENQILC